MKQEINRIEKARQNVVVLGSTGMIGSTVTQYFSQKTFSLIEVNRRGYPVVDGNKCIKFDIEKDSLSDAIKLFPRNSIVINLTGLIRHKIDASLEENINQVVKINSEFPHNLVAESNKYGIKVIQIVTDCVFSGSSGAYTEDSAFDPVDIYGVSKVNGELSADNLLNLRMSVIGKEIESNLELMSWILSMPANSSVSGFSNHHWNGVTALQVGELLEGIIREELEVFGTYHVVPSSPISKLDLLVDICSVFDKRDIVITPSEAPVSVDRTLATNFPEINREIWKNAGYLEPPDIHSMLEKYRDWVEFTRIGSPSGKS